MILKIENVRKKPPAQQLKKSYCFIVKGKMPLTSFG